MDNTRVIRWSFFLIFFVIISVAVFKLATPFLTVLFSCFALQTFKIKDKTWIAITLFLIVVCTVSYGFVFFIIESLNALPEIIDKSLPIILTHAREWGINLPFSDAESLKAVVVGTVGEEVKGVARFAEIATKEFVVLILGIVVAISIFLNHKLDLNSEGYTLKNNLYTHFCAALSDRFATFYKSFSTVMGAQIVISTINTFFTSVMVFAIDLPYARTIVIITFLCGLIPIIGNIISNTIITCIAITESLKLAVIALIFLIVIHKFEYFLNSKIIGGRIKNPMWLTLLSLIVGERVMGIPGMILAPVVLHYIKSEASKVEVN